MTLYYGRIVTIIVEDIVTDECLITTKLELLKVSLREVVRQ